MLHLFCLASSDLIETLWNVKDVRIDGETYVCRFNRDIVECKEKFLKPIILQIRKI